MTGKDDFMVKFLWNIRSVDFMGQHLIFEAKKELKSVHQVYGLRFIGEEKDDSDTGRMAKAGESWDILGQSNWKSGHKSAGQFTTLHPYCNIKSIEDSRNFYLTNGLPSSQKWKDGIISCRSTLESQVGPIWIATDEPVFAMMKKRPIWGSCLKLPEWAEPSG